MVIWTKLLPWITLALAAYGYWKHDTAALLFAIFLMAGAIYWKLERDP